MKNINKRILDKSKIELIDLGQEYKIELTISKELYNDINMTKDPIRTGKAKQQTTKEMINETRQMIQTTNELLVKHIADQDKRWEKQAEFNQKQVQFNEAILNLPTIKKELGLK